MHYPALSPLRGSGWEGGGGGVANVNCQLKCHLFISSQLNFGPFVLCYLSGKKLNVLIDWPLCRGFFAAGTSFSASCCCGGVAVVEWYVKKRMNL